MGSLMPAWLMPVAASTHAAKVDRIFIGLTLVSAAIVLLVVGLVVTFAIRYRRGSNAERGPLPEVVSREFEIGWTAATLFLFVFIFWWAASADIGAFSPPADALEIHVVAKQWMWKTQHLERRPRDQRAARAGRHAGAAGHDLAGRHPFLLHPGLPPQAGRRAGPDHRDLVPGDRRPASSRCSAPSIAAPTIRRMRGRVVVMEPRGLRRLALGPARGRRPRPPGRTLFAARAARAATRRAPTVHAPNLAGIWGQAVQLDGGKRATAMPPTSATRSCSRSATSWRATARSCRATRGCSTTARSRA